VLFSGSQFAIQGRNTLAKEARMEAIGRLLAELANNPPYE
jgi:hypothetical protein